MFLQPGVYSIYSACIVPYLLGTRFKADKAESNKNRYFQYFMVVP